MSEPAPETLDSEKDKLFITDAELIRRLGVPTKVGRAALHELEMRRPGQMLFPLKDPLFGGRRFWPAVERYLMLRHGLGDGMRLAAPQWQWQEKADASPEAGPTGESRNPRLDLETPHQVLGRLLDAADRHSGKGISRRKSVALASISAAGCDPD